LRVHIKGPVIGGNLSENAARGKRQWTKKVASRVIVPMPPDSGKCAATAKAKAGASCQTRLNRCLPLPVRIIRC
jgi:hypothetical protein